MSSCLVLGDYALSYADGQEMIEKALRWLVVKQGVRKFYLGAGDMERRCAFFLRKLQAEFENIEIVLKLPFESEYGEDAKWVFSGIYWKIGRNYKMYRSAKKKKKKFAYLIREELQEKPKRKAIEMQMLGSLSVLRDDEETYEIIKKMASLDKDWEEKRDKMEKILHRFDLE